MEVVHRKKHVFLLKLHGQDPPGVGIRAARVLPRH